MAKAAVDIRLVGDKAFIAALGRFEPRIQRKIVRQALRRSARRLQARVAANLSGTPVKQKTGRYLAAWMAQRPKATKRSRTMIGQMIAMPTRDELEIPSGDEGYYPFSLEYGYTRTRRAPVHVPAKAPIRRAVNAHTKEEHLIMGREIGKGIEREAKAAFRKVRA